MEPSIKITARAKRYPQIRFKNSIFITSILLNLESRFAPFHGLCGKLIKIVWHFLCFLKPFPHLFQNFFLQP